MHQEHLDHACNINRLGGVFRQHYCHQCQVPGMLGAVLPPGAIAEGSLAQHLFELVDLENEGKLPRQAVTNYAWPFQASSLSALLKHQEAPAPRRQYILVYSTARCVPLCRMERCQCLRRMHTARWDIS